MAGDFTERIDELQARVGAGKLEMRVNVHQPYAAAEHNRMYYKHPRGGMANYLQAPFESEHSDQLQILADGVLEDLDGAAIEAVQRFDEWIKEFAPVEFDVLRNSANLYVENDGVTIYEKPQEAPYESWKE